MCERTAEYEIFHKKIVEIVVASLGEENRYFFDECCDYLEEFEAGESPEDVAQAQIEAVE